MNDKDLIHAITTNHPEITQTQILAALEAERTKTGGLIADSTLLRLIAAHYNIEIPRAPTSDYKLLISHLVPNLNRITVSGRIVAVFAPKNFEGEKPGKYASLIITDKTGVLRVMLWNGKTELVESATVKVGQVARFLQGYTREDRSGKTELHISEKSDVEVKPRGFAEEDYPTIDRFATAVKNLRSQQSNVHLVGKVTTISTSSTFTRQDNTTGKVLRFTMADGTGEVSVIAWNGKAETLETTMTAKADIKMVNARVKPDQNGGVEVHVDEATYVEIL